MKALLFANTDWFLYRFERELAHALVAAGAEVVLVAPPGQYSEQLEAEGLPVRPFPIERRRLGPWRELATLRRLRRLLRQERPDLLHSFTLKCVVYSALVGRRVGVPTIIGSITGLGHLYAARGWRIRGLRALFETLVGPALRGSHTIFLNRDDQTYFQQRRLVDPAATTWIASSGVDVDRFTPGEGSLDLQDDPRPLVVLPARLLRSKGVEVFLDAARHSREGGLSARWALVGATDPGNPEGIPDDALEVACRSAGVERWGFVEDMIDVYRRAAVVCLPTLYREGVPTVLLEAAACGRPTVASDMPGCRDAIDDGVTGLLVPPGDAEALTDAVATLLADTERGQAMGRRARQRMVETFAVERVVADTLALYRRLGLPIPEPPAQPRSPRP